MESMNEMGEGIKRPTKLALAFWMEEATFCLFTLLDAVLAEADFSIFTDFHPPVSLLDPPVSILGTTVGCTQTFWGTAELKSVKVFQSLWSLKDMILSNRVDFKAKEDGWYWLSCLWFKNRKFYNNEAWKRWHLSSSRCSNV